MQAEPGIKHLLLQQTAKILWKDGEMRGRTCNIWEAEWPSCKDLFTSRPDSGVIHDVVDNSYPATNKRWHLS